MDPVTTGALISGAAGIIGGAMSGEGGMKPEHQLLEQYKMQKEFAMHGLEWRADDARKAGLHPLAALGTQPSSFSPIGLWDGGRGRKESIGAAIAAAGQGVGNAVASQQTPHQRAVNQAQLRLMEAQAQNDFAQASYWTSEAARRSAVPSNPVPEIEGVTTSPVHRSKIESHPLTYDHIKPKADEQISARSDYKALSAGTHPGMREYTWRSGPQGDTRIMLPHSDEGPAEALESTPIYMYPAIIKDNIRKYGPSWLLEVLGWSSPGSGTKGWAAPPEKEKYPNRVQSGRITYER